MKTKQYSLWERFTLPSPAFFNRVKGFGVALVALSASLIKLNIVPETITTVMATAGAVMGLVAQFSVDTAKAELIK